MAEYHEAADEAAEEEAVEAETACGMERAGGVEAAKGAAGWWCGLDESSSATLGRVGYAAGWWSGERACVSGLARGRRQSLAIVGREGRGRRG